MTAALDLDPYLLPLPAPDSPVVLPHRATSLHAHLNGRYADPAWPLAPLTGNPSVTKVVIGWDRWPAAFRDEMRLAAWNLINGQLRPAFLHARGTTMRSRLGLSGVHYTIEHWKALAAWLADRGIGRLADCGPDILHEYGLHVRDSGRSRSVVAKILVSLTRLWALNRSAPARMASAARRGKTAESTTTCPPRRALAAGRTQRSPSPSRPWARC